MRRHSPFTFSEFFLAYCFVLIESFILFESDHLLVTFEFYLFYLFNNDSTVKSVNFFNLLPLREEDKLHSLPGPTCIPLYKGLSHKPGLTVNSDSID